MTHFVAIHFGGSTLALSLVRAERGNMEVEKTFYEFTGGRNIDSRIETKLNRIVMKAFPSAEIPADKKKDVEHDLNKIAISVKHALYGGSKPEVTIS